MSGDLVLGIDLGTTTVKVVLIEAADESVVGVWSRETKASVPSSAGPLGSEQDVTKIMTAVDTCMLEIPLDLAVRITKVGVSGQMHGVVMWKRSATENSSEFSAEMVVNGFSRLSNLYTWQDGRCNAEFIKSLPLPDSHLRIATGFGCCTMFWLNSHEPGCLECYDCAGTVQDLLVAVLCGLETPLMSPHNAASWGYYNTVSASWNTDIRPWAGIQFCKEFDDDHTDSVRLLPRVVEAGQMAGKTAGTWHGIVPGTPVTAALGDLQCYMIAKLQHDTDAVINIGTSAQFTFLMPASFRPDTADALPSVEYPPYFSGRYLSETASLNGGNVLAAFVTTLQQWLAELGFKSREDELWKRLSVFTALEEELHLPGVNNSAGGERLHIETTLLGERHAPDRRGINVSGAIPSNTSLRAVFQSLSRGVVTNLRSMSPSGEQLRNVQRIVGTGGALTRNAIMRAAVSRLYELPLVIDDSQTDNADSALGAAVAANRFLGINGAK